jgi:hypothetical protein
MKFTAEERTTLVNWSVVVAAKSWAPSPLTGKAISPSNVALL